MVVHVYNSRTFETITEGHSEVRGHPWKISTFGLVCASRPIDQIFVLSNEQSDLLKITLNIYIIFR